MYPLENFGIPLHITKKNVYKLVLLFFTLKRGKKSMHEAKKVTSLNHTLQQIDTNTTTLLICK